MIKLGPVRNPQASVDIAVLGSIGSYPTQRRRCCLCYFNLPGRAVATKIMDYYPFYILWGPQGELSL